MSSGWSQEVAISEELNIRNYFSYDLIGKINNRILVYRDKGFTKEVDVYNEEMEHTQYSEFHFEKKKTDVFAMVSMDSVFHVIYGFLEKDSLVIKMREYDHLVRLVDSLTLTKIYKKEIKKRFSNTISEDKTKVLLSTTGPDQNHLFLIYDYNRKKITWKKKIKFEGSSNNRIKKIQLTNGGQFFVFQKRENEKNKNIPFYYFDPLTGNQSLSNLEFQDYVYNNIYIDYDNKNRNLVICGNYSEKLGKESKGIYVYKKNINAINVLDQPNFLPHKPSLSDELLQGKKRQRKRILDNLLVKEIIFRNDGGLLLVSEIRKEFSRRSPYNSTFNRGTNSNSYTRRGWIDYYNDDIVITNFDNNLNVDWTKVLYKKQFSQDDEAVFSSFYVMKTPSRLRFIYNDEIKNNSTVSEYLMDPTGKIARNSLLSTEYQNMKLRFQDALQLSSNSILVPSEKNYDLNLVKITY